LQEWTALLELEEELKLFATDKEAFEANLASLEKELQDAHNRKRELAQQVCLLNASPKRFSDTSLSHTQPHCNA
jgi:chromosome segregation ATPase